MYKHIKIPKTLKELLINKIKMRAYKSSLHIEEIAKLLNNELNLDDSSKNLLGFLLEYHYYSINERNILNIIEKFKHLTKYLDSVLMIKLRVNFGDDNNTGEYLRVLKNKKVSAALLDIVKQIKKTSNYDYNINLATEIIKFNTRISSFN